MNINEDTEFNDALRQQGILPPKREKTPTPSPPPSPTLQARLDDKTIDEIDDLLDEANDSDAERLMQSYRAKRLKEMKQEKQLHRFGDLLPISRDDYTREVAEASKVNEEDDEQGKGTGVVCLLYVEGVHPPSVRIMSQLRTLAARYPRSKFTCIPGNKCIPNYPDKMQPTLILYRAGTIKEQLVAWGAKAEGTLEELEAVLIHNSIIEPTRVFMSDSRAKEKDSDGEDEDEDEHPKKLKSGSNFASSKKSAPRKQTTEDSDSDFDL